MDLNIPTRTKLSVNIYGQELKLTKPTILQSESLSEKMKGIKQEEQFPLMLDFLKDCGLPIELAKQLEIEHFTQLVELLVGKKK